MHPATFDHLMRWAIKHTDTPEDATYLALAVVDYLDSLSPDEAVNMLTLGWSAIVRHLDTLNATKQSGNPIR